MPLTEAEIDALAREPLEIEGDQGRFKNRTIADALEGNAAAATAAALANGQSGWGALRAARIVPPGSIGQSGE
jgi:hypothetical protein